MNIGEVAAASGLPPKTIRYYEDIRLITPQRSPNGYRSFGRSDQHKLAFLARARSLGFTIDDCRALLALYDDEGRSSEDVKRITADHLATVRRKIAELESIGTELDRLVASCDGGRRPDCPILEDFAHGVKGPRS